MSFGIYKGVSECLSHSFAHEIPHVLYKRFKRVISMVLNPKIEASLFDWTWPFTETSSSIKIPLKLLHCFTPDSTKLYSIVCSLEKSSSLSLLRQLIGNLCLYPKKIIYIMGSYLKLFPGSDQHYWCQGKQLKLIWLGILPQSYLSFLLKLSKWKVPERNGVMDGAVAGETKGPGFDPSNI